MKTKTTYWDKEKKDIKEIQVFAKNKEEKEFMLQILLMYGCLSEKLKVIVPEPCKERML